MSVVKFGKLNYCIQLITVKQFIQFSYLLLGFTIHNECCQHPFSYFPSPINSTNCFFCFFISLSKQPFSCEDCPEHGTVPEISRDKTSSCHIPNSSHHLMNYKITEEAENTGRSTCLVKKILQVDLWREICSERCSQLTRFSKSESSISAPIRELEFPM